MERTNSTAPSFVMRSHLIHSDSSWTTERGPASRACGAGDAVAGRLIRDFQRAGHHRDHHPAGQCVKGKRSWAEAQEHHAVLRPLTHINTEEGPAGVEAGRGPRPPRVGSASSDGTKAPDAFSDPAFAFSYGQEEKEDGCIQSLKEKPLAVDEPERRSSASRGLEERRGLQVSRRHVTSFRQALDQPQVCRPLHTPPGEDGRGLTQTRPAAEQQQSEALVCGPGVFM
ncbi:hypothetical protein D623_10013223 [Myotis brandtii]|uniref:Uncharacterized protein n=1 Tax=Myotis brandtii TaxID=109478 RepID=S7PWE6_MYOBR|nr:hypothetical protein D623_10013223 [Myotis brandtii]